MKYIVKIVYILLSILFLYYLFIPNVKFPFPPSDSIQSFEPADQETPLRKGYFSDLERQVILKSYQDQWRTPLVFNVPFLSFRLNYPPEEAQTIIRDQTKSTFLEEIVHPFRESIFINGFKPSLGKDAIVVEGKNWKQKIIVRLVQSNIVLRVLIGIITLVLIPIIYYCYKKAFTDLKNSLKGVWIYR